MPLQLRLVQPEAHTRLAVNRRCDAKVLLRLMVFGGTPEERAEAEVAVGNQGPHTARLGERQCLAVVGFTAFRIESVGMRRDVPEQMVRMGRKADLIR